MEHSEVLMLEQPEKLRVTLNVAALLSGRERRGSERVVMEMKTGLFRGCRTSSCNFKNIFSCTTLRSSSEKQVVSVIEDNI